MVSTSRPKRNNKKINSAAATRRLHQSTNKRFTQGVVDTGIFDSVDQQRRKSTRNDQDDADDDQDDDDEWAAPGTKKSSNLRKSSRSSTGNTNAQQAYDLDSDPESDEEKKKKVWTKDNLFEEIDEEIIEKVVDHRKRSDQVEEYLIKWKCWAHIHNTWLTRDELAIYKGFKKVENYIKKNQENENRNAHSTAEEVEQFNVMHEMERNMIEKWSKVDRIIATKKSKPQPETGEIKDEYLVKWKYLPYSECTWEFKETISDFEKEINEFNHREASQGYEYPQIGQQARTGFTPMTKQPEWLKFQLRDYQLEGINWLHLGWCSYNNVILADEMGLGKTIQSITFLNYLFHERNIPGPFLVVVPLSTLHGWLKEFHKWAPELYVISYIGDGKSRQIIREYEMFHDADEGKRFKFNVLLTTYELILKDHEYLNKIRYSYLAIDEAHRLKNDKSKLYENLFDFHTAGRLLITGTPLQNSIRELWCLLHFLMPEKFDNAVAFEKQYSNLAQDDLNKLHETLGPHILRRLKADVEKSLPRKMERILRVGLSDLQVQYQRYILQKNFSELNKSGTKPSSLLNIVVELKKVCNHPYLFESARDRVDHANKTALYNLIHASGKMILLDKLLSRLKETGHRVLIFSQMVKMLDVLAEYLALRGFQFQRLDGSTSSRQRHIVVDHFNAENSTDFCFLLSTRAGGLGINLATADTVIIFDSDWNPQNDLQAEARAHRIGQTKTVNIYRLVTSHSVEEKILEAAKQKMILDHLVIQKMDTSGRMVQQVNKSNFSQFTKDELEQVLKFGAADLFSNKEQSDPNQESQSQKTLSELNIDEILARAETTDKTQQEAEMAGNSSIMSSFKVANFQMTTTGSTTQPPSWEEIMGKHSKSNVEEHLPPRRRRNKTYREGDDDDYDPSMSTSESHSDPLSLLSQKETRVLIKSFKKYFDLNQSKSIVQDSNLTNHSNHLLEKCIQQLMQKCENQHYDKLKQDDFIMINKNKIQVSEVMNRRDQLKAARASIADYAKHHSLLNPKSVRSWGEPSWTIHDDVNLIRGILKYGLGNYDAIRADDDLKLYKKIDGGTADQKPANKAVKPAQLSKRVDLLLVQIHNEFINPSSTTTSSTSVVDKKKKKKRRKATDQDLLALCDDHFVPIRDTLSQFCEMTDDDDSVSKKDRLVRIKKYLMVIGNFIEKTVASREDMFSDFDTSDDQVTRVMWRFVHDKGNTSGDSDTLQNLYRRLNSKKESDGQKSAAAAPSSEVDAPAVDKKTPEKKSSGGVDKKKKVERKAPTKRGMPDPISPTASSAASTPSTGHRSKRNVNYREHDSGDEDDDDSYRPKKKKKN
ncbi:chromodomain-helicase-DNA-binding protein [Acrasis kona]|uniref:Chromodomain-helicase-DNA-binding protein n=1 Tax=Acrasis kona TaxID=1008807 RepID=A0AAW2ZNH1_9EUKA